MPWAGINQAFGLEASACQYGFRSRGPSRIYASHIQRLLRLLQDYSASYVRLPQR
jgi:hypothetical protein